MVGVDSSQPVLDRLPSTGRPDRQSSIRLQLVKGVSLEFLTEVQFFILQLAIRNEQICLSSGYSFRFIGQASVKEIRILYSTDPCGKILM